MSLIKFCRFAVLAAALGFSLNDCEALAATYRFVAINAPGVQPQVATIPIDLDNRDKAIVTTSNVLTFLYDQGRFTPIAYPGARFTPFAKTNASGVIWGSYETGVNLDTHGYILKNGAYAPQAFMPQSMSSLIIWINDTGATVGNYKDNSGKFAYAESGGVFTKIIPAGSLLATVTDLSNAGVAVGTALGADACPINSCGFTYAAGKIAMITTFSSPISDLRINAAGDIIANQYSNGVFHGFLGRDNKFTKLEPPKAQESFATAINQAGQIAGWYRDLLGGVHGYVWTKGAFTIVDYPGAGVTTLRDLNDNGTILGSYVPNTAAAVEGAFIGTPVP